MSSLLGHVYYTPRDDGGGDVKIISFTPRPVDEVVNLSLATFDIQWLSDFMKLEPDIGSYTLAFDIEGKPVLDVIKPIIDNKKYEEAFYHIDKYSGEPGIVVIVSPDVGECDIVVWGGLSDTIRRATSQTITFYITDMMEPNVIHQTVDVLISDMLSGDASITGLPDGYPLDTYSIWALTPDTQLKIWWTIKHDHG